MKNYKEKFIDKISEVEEIKKQLWWWIIYRLENYKGWYCFKWTKDECLKHLWSWKAPNWFDNVKKFIWDRNKLDYHHLMMYFKITHETKDYSTPRISFFYHVLFLIDPSKNLDLQDEEIYKQILEYIDEVK